MAGRRSPASLVIAVVVGIALIALLRGVFRDGDNGPSGDGPQPDQAAEPREGCIGLRVVGSSEKAALLGQIATDYERRNPEVDGECVDVQVTSKSSGGAAEALARGWDADVDGPRPDVWSPASSSWVVILRQRLAAQDRPNIVPSQLPHVAETPLVIAMPRPMATALGWPRKAIGWADVLSLARDPAGWGKHGHPEWGAFRLGKTNPNFSTSGLNATIGAYFAATGRSSDLLPKDITDPKVVDFVKGVEQSVVHYGDITLTFLDNLLRADDRGAGLAYISAVTVEEKSVWDYNQGNPKGDPAELGKHARPKTPLVAVYPKEGTLLSDNPYVVLDAPWVDDARKQAARDFLRFLQAPDQQRRFQAAAFRDFRGRAGDVIRPSNGLLPSEPEVVLAPPAPGVLDRIQRSWQDLRKRARVLLVIDVSGSMGEAVPTAGASKLDLAKEAAANALDQFAADDEVGLWIFSSDLDGGKFSVELVPIAPVGESRGELKQRIASLVPRNGTALYATARTAVAKMRDEFDPKRINAVVLLTDGRNEYPPDTDLKGLLRQLRSEGEDVAVRVFPIAYGDDADLDTLKLIAEASRAAAYDSKDPASIDKVFTAVISNF
jgi:Ca-activated chloride channel family protein